MADLEKLRLKDKKEIFNDLLFEGLTYEEVSKKYGIEPEQIAEYINNVAVQPYNEAYRLQHEEENKLHKKHVIAWISKPLIVAILSFLCIILVQYVASGFDTAEILKAITFITHTLAKIMSLGLAVSFMMLFLQVHFPIITTFINEKVNTISLKETLLGATNDGRLNFLAKVLLALCILTGLVFSSAKAQTLEKRKCIVAIATKEVGTVETGGNNRGKKIDMYRSVCENKNISGYSDAWCGYFVGYVFNTCDVRTKVNFKPRARDWFSDTKKVIWRKNFQYGIFHSEPKAGDLIGYRFKAGNIGHIEILAEWHEEEGYFLSVGGNTSPYNSVYRDANKADGVRMKKRQIDTAYIISNHID